MHECTPVPHEIPLSPELLGEARGDRSRPWAVFEPGSPGQEGPPVPLAGGGR